MPVAEVARHMLDAYPREFNVDRPVWIRSIEACFDCATTGRVVSRQTEYDANVTRAVLQACIVDAIR